MINLTATAEGWQQSGAAVLEAKAPPPKERYIHHGENVAAIDNTQERLLLTLDEAAFLLRVKRCTVYALITQGEIDAVKVGRLIRVPRKSIDCYIDKKVSEQYGTWGLMR